MERLKHIPWIGSGSSVTTTGIFRKVRLFVIVYATFMILFNLVSYCYGFYIGVKQAQKFNMYNQPPAFDESKVSFYSGNSTVDFSSTIIASNYGGGRNNIQDDSVNIEKQFHDWSHFVNVMSILHFTLTVTAVWYLRNRIRSRYSIQGGCCQDFLCAICCNPCTIAQMMRHTTDYDTYVSKCCTATGVPNYAPSIV
jgi:Cys-rich protein (TIGR01571 family)